jgi:hypothetical protein
MNPSQSTHRQTFTNLLLETIRLRSSDESLTFASGSVRVILEWLGYENDDLTFIDSQDRGIDVWLDSDKGFDLFQVKTHEVNSISDLDVMKFDSSGVHDIQRALSFFLNENPSQINKKELKQLLNKRDSALRSYKLEESTSPISLNIYLIILGNQLTEAANREFNILKEENKDITYIDSVPIKIHIVLLTLDDIINGRWREGNREWLDSRGRKYEKINLRLGSEGFINDHANAVFYCKAIDLVRAYDTLGYQIFEPNVRANITNSKVNLAIRESVLHQRSRRDFRFLNNGVTITCDSFSKPVAQREHFIVVRPGIVNGLQTVVALHKAYAQLSEEEKEDFEKNCSVLVRLLMNTAVDDITRVVKATNNQNPMKLRNLFSNNPEQLIYARIFSEELNWFYEAKEGAWEAFDKDPKRWRPSLNKKPRDFRSITRSRRKVRRIDNSTLAQTWLAFIGFSHEAVNEKKGLFSDRFYPLIFMQRTNHHGVDYDFSLARVREDTQDQSPDAAMMLVSYLAWNFAVDAVPSSSQNRQDACARADIDITRLSKTELDAQLSNDKLFLLNQALAGMSMLFVEFLGFILFRSLGERVHQYGSRILHNYSFSSLKEQFDTETIREEIKKGEFNPQDLIIIIWLVFVETIEDLIASGWGDSYRAAPVKVRFIYSRETRDKLYRELQNTNEYMKKRNVKKLWAIGVADNQGLFDFIRSCVEN